MERVSFEIERQDVADALHAKAEAQGHSVAAEVASLVEQVYGAPTTAEASRARIERLAQSAGGIDFQPPPRQPLVDERAARIRAMPDPEFIDHLIATANGATLELPERRIDPERDIFGAD